MFFLLFAGFYTSQVVQDFFHQQYVLESKLLMLGMVIPPLTPTTGKQWEFRPQHAYPWLLLVQILEAPVQLDN